MARKSESKSEERELTDAELRFVDEFLIDRDAFAAARRAGVASIVIKRTVQKWTTDPAIARMIQLKTDTADLDKMVSPQRIMAGFIDVAFDRTAPASARNSALRELAEIKKMYPDKKPENPGGSGVLLIPATAETLDDWNRAAQASQDRLKKSVKD